MPPQVQAHRVAARYWRGAAGDLSYRHAALAIQNRVSELWAVDMHPNAVVGGGLLLDHATGVVVGETAEIGDDCTILHAVTLGGTGKERGDRHPKIGAGCTLGAGATILGNIRVGDGATVGSQAVVTKDVPSRVEIVDGSSTRVEEPPVAFVSSNFEQIWYAPVSRCLRA